MGAPDLDFLTQPINVHWGGGLAVEFTQRPDYLTMNQALAMNKVAISFWFRVPTEAATLVRSREMLFWEYRVFLGVIPLITWGPQQTTPVSEVQVYDTGAIDSSAGIITLERVTETHTAPLQPSCIGVRVGSTLAPADPPTLDVHIQTNAHASGIGLAQIRTSFTGQYAGNNQNPGPNFGKPIYAFVEYTTTDVSYMVTEEPEYLGNSDSNSTSAGAGHPEVTLDQWHHLLISWDLIGHSNMGGASKMWCAIDDKNRDGNDLPAMNDLSKMGPNDHMTGTVFLQEGNPDVSVSVSFGSDDVPSNPFRLPAPPSVQYSTDDQGGTGTLQPIAKVELAELQIFSGVTLDASKEANRRAFIDFVRDADGTPIRDEHGKRTLKPVNPAKAEVLLGKKPAVLLHGTTKWQNGKNTGSLGINTEGEEIPSGQFHPTGEIKKYPDPEIVES